MTTVFICDDHRIVREGLKQFVQSVPGVVRVETAGGGGYGEASRRDPEQRRADLVAGRITVP